MCRLFLFLVLTVGLTEILCLGTLNSDNEGTIISIEDLSIPLQTTRVLVPGYQEFTLVFEDLSCKFRIRMKEKDGGQHYKYRAGAFSGVSSTGGKNITTRDCTVFTCTGDSIDTCGQRFTPYNENSTATFEELFVEATTPATKYNPNMQKYNYTFCPVSWTLSLLPLGPENFDYFIKENDNDTIHILSLKTRDIDLYAFAILGRQTEIDSDNLTDSFADVIDKEEKDRDKERWTVKICNDEREETQEDNDEDLVQNLKTFKNLHPAHNVNN